MTAAAPPSPPTASAGTTPYDPLRLCVFATIALIAWVAGPLAVVVFAGLGFAGYVRAGGPGSSARSASCATPDWCWHTWACSPSPEPSEWC